jgi:hypothetical protein
MCKSLLQYTIRQCTVTAVVMFPKRNSSLGMSERLFRLSHVSSWVSMTANEALCVDDWMPDNACGVQ